MTDDVLCGCGEHACDYLEAGYPWCRSCREHHRPPECAVDEQGRSLDPYGEPWPDAVERHAATPTTDAREASDGQ